MRFRNINLLILVVTLFAVNGCVQNQSQKEEKKCNAIWYKGNTHCHSTNSDGDVAPFAVVEWYHNHGYHFLVISDHNILTPPDTVKRPENVRENFLLIQGEEVTDQNDVHSTAFNIKDYIPFSVEPRFPSTTTMMERFMIMYELVGIPSAYSSSELLQMHIDSILAQDGIPFLNHPNWASGLSVEDILPVERLRFMEVYNGHPDVKNWGSDKHIPVEAKWDSLLSKGKLIYGVASDDTHDYLKFSDRDANPGRGWIMVKSDSLDAEAISKSLEKGDFYATMGVMLSELSFSESIYKIAIDTAITNEELKHTNTVPRIDVTGAEGYTIDFIGYKGEVLKTVQGLKSQYKAKQGDKYIRCRITKCSKSEKGFEKIFAWTQPIIIDHGFFNND
ncbi:hypothetical protein ES708_16387 [subsurface metagenome]